MKSPPIPIPRQLFGPIPAAQYLGVCRRTMYNLQAAGTFEPDVQLPGRIAGKTRGMYSKAHLDNFINKHRVWVPNPAAA